jgi:hypothetical protein
MGAAMYDGCVMGVIIDAQWAQDGHNDRCMMGTAMYDGHVIGVATYDRHAMGVITDA